MGSRTLAPPRRAACVFCLDTWPLVGFFVLRVRGVSLSDCPWAAGRAFGSLLRCDSCVLSAVPCPSGPPLLPDLLTLTVFSSPPTFSHCFVS